MKLRSIIILSAAFALPFWVSIGRVIFGSFGWIGAVYLFTVTPLLFIALLVLFFMTLKLQFKIVDYILFTLLYVSLFLHGVFMVDFGDTKDSQSSVFTNIFGRQFLDIASTLWLVFGFTAVILIITVFVRLVYLRFNSVNDTIPPMRA